MLMLSAFFEGPLLVIPIVLVVCLIGFGWSLWTAVRNGERLLPRALAGGTTFLIFFAPVILIFYLISIADWSKQ
jgi:hypothetical protein